MSSGNHNTDNSLYNEAVSEKIFVAEKNIALLRFFVIIFNTFAYLVLMHGKGPYPWLAYALIVVANTYSVFVIVVKPYRKYPIFLAGYFTYITDAVLISLWLLATGTYESPFFVLWYISIVAVAFRFSYTITIFTAFLYSICYALLIAVHDGVLFSHVTEMSVRIGYIFLSAMLGGVITKETFSQTHEKVLMQKLAEDAKKAERTLKIQTDLYESVLKIQSDMGEGISITKANRFEYVNDALCKIYGYSEAELMAMTSFMDLIDPEEKENIAQRMKIRSLGSKSVSDYSETVIINKSGKKVIIGCDKA